ncbi:hypothetical protein N9K75_01645 [bacterium]|nr:hypothetical protein [bacterium]
MSFFTDLRDTHGSGASVPMVQSFDLDISGLPPGPFGWPILPHGGGAYYNIIGRYIAVPSATLGQTYGEYMPSKGELLGFSVNWLNNSGISHNVFMANYGPSNPMVSLSALGSIALGSGSTYLSRQVGNGIPFVQGDYIGIYVEDGGGGGTPPPPVIVEGTIYFSLRY